jgi:hypothetical protein
MAASQQFFYDAQIERFLAQFIRIVSGFQVEFGNNTLQRVPVYWGDSSRQVQSIISQNSGGSIMPAVPAMTVYISGISYDRARVQEPNYIGKMHIRQKYYNEETQEFENRQGNAFTIERTMPVPYTIELKLDIWTSNTKQKLQLFEQIVGLFNPALEIQSTDNYIDWTSLSVIYLDSTNWSSRSVPIGTENPIDVMTLTFSLPVWVSAPAKVKKLGVIQKIIASIYDSDGNLADDILNDTNIISRQYFTPMGYGILLIGNQLTLLKSSEVTTSRDPTLLIPTKIGTKDSWSSLVNVYGQLKNGTSQIRLLQEDEASEVVGTVSYHPTDDSILIFNADIDTYPTNTLTAISAIIDPYKNTNTSITQPAAGTRYLILNDIGDFNNASGADAWQGSDGRDLVAHANDIIEYNGTHWSISFDSQSTSTLQYVSNLTTGTQYKWNNNQWVKSWEGEYKEGLWTLVL